MRIMKSVMAIVAICATLLGVRLMWSRRTAAAAADGGPGRHQAAHRDN